MLNNKLGQVSETMTWFVATIVVIVILGFSVFIVSGMASSKSLVEGEFQDNQQRDLVSEKSISSFLLGENNFDLIKESIAKDNYSDLENKLVVFLKPLTFMKKKSRILWNFQLIQDKSVKYSFISIGFYDVLGKAFSENFKTYSLTFYTFNLGEKTFIIRFWGEEVENEK